MFAVLFSLFRRKRGLGRRLRHAAAPEDSARALPKGSRASEKLHQRPENDAKAGIATQTRQSCFDQACSRLKA